MLKPQDVVMLLKVKLLEESSWTYQTLAFSLGMSSSTVFLGLERCKLAQLYEGEERKVILPAFLNLLFHGVRAVFYVVPGALTQGIPTAFSAPPLSDCFPEHSHGILIWPSSEGKVTGQTIEPLYSSVPEAVRLDPKLYELLALIDVLRLGNPKECKIAQKRLRELLKSEA